MEYRNFNISSHDKKKNNNNRYENHQCTKNCSCRRFREDFRNTARACNQLLQLAGRVPLFAKGNIQAVP